MIILCIFTYFYYVFGCIWYGLLARFNQLFASDPVDLQMSAVWHLWGVFSVSVLISETMLNSSNRQICCVYLCFFFFFWENMILGDSSSHLSTTYCLSTADKKHSEICTLVLRLNWEAKLSVVENQHFWCVKLNICQVQPWRDCILAVKAHPGLCSCARWGRQPWISMLQHQAIVHQVEIIWSKFWLIFFQFRFC